MNIPFTRKKFEGASFVIGVALMVVLLVIPVVSNIVLKPIIAIRDKIAGNNK